MVSIVPVLFTYKYLYIPCGDNGKNFILYQQFHLGDQLLYSLDLYALFCIERLVPGHLTGFKELRSNIIHISLLNQRLYI